MQLKKVLTKPGTIHAQAIMWDGTVEMTRYIEDVMAFVCHVTETQNDKDLRRSKLLTFKDFDKKTSYTCPKGWWIVVQTSTAGTSHIQVLSPVDFSKLFEVVE